MPVGDKDRTGREDGPRNPEELRRTWGRVAAVRVQGIGGGAVHKDQAGKFLSL